MREAASMLIANELSVDQIARSVGYSSRSSFLKAFHDAYGVHPSDYRVQHLTGIASRTGQRSVMKNKTARGQHG
jgi:AraC family transcriptional activator of mtrCDE